MSSIPRRRPTWVGKKTYTKYPRRRTSKASRVKKAVKNEVQLCNEKKFFDATYSVFIPTSTDASGGEVDPPTLLSLNCPSQGDTPTQRDGRSISMDSIDVRGVVTCGAQSQTNPDVVPDVLIALVLDLQTNGAQLRSEDVYTNPGATGSNPSVLATCVFRNLSYASRFTILASRRITPTDFAGAIQPIDSGSVRQQGAVVPFSLHADLRGMKTNFIAGETDSTIGAIADKSVHLIAYTSDDGTQPVLRYNSRLRFWG